MMVCLSASKLCLQSHVTFSCYFRICCPHHRLAKAIWHREACSCKASVKRRRFSGFGDNSSPSRALFKHPGHHELERCLFGHKLLFSLLLAFFRLLFCCFFVREQAKLDDFLRSGVYSEKLLRVALLYGFGACIPFFRCRLATSAAKVCTSPPCTACWPRNSAKQKPRCHRQSRSQGLGKFLPSHRTSAVFKPSESHTLHRRNR